MRNYRAVVENFAHDFFYSDGQNYAFSAPDELLAFFRDDQGYEQNCVFRNVAFDEARQAGAAEYTYRGTRTYHGTAWIELEADDIVSWSEYQYISKKDWREFWRKQ